MWKFNGFGDSVAAIDEQGSISYQQMQSEGEALAKAVEGRCLVFALCRNTIGSLLGYAGFVNNGIVPLLLDDGIDRELLGALLDTYKPMYLWLADEFAGEFGFVRVYSSRGFTLLRTDYAQFSLNDELALLLTTSGSTGSPKLVRQSAGNILSNSRSIVEYLEIDSTERPITTLPMSYTYGLSVINSHLLVGATLVMTTKGYMQREFWDTFKTQGATSIAGVPYNYEILKKLRFLSMNLPSLRYFTQAGGKLSPELHMEYAEYAERNGKRFYVMYGQTEATARMSYLPYRRSLEKCGSMGIAIPGGEFNLIGIDGNAVTEPEVVGELVYKGDNVTLGYAERGEDLCKGDENHGVLITGDMAKRDSDGYYTIVGRKKRFLKIFGNRVNLDEAEHLIKSEFDVDCACIGVDDRMTIYVTSMAISSDVKKFMVGKTGLHHSAFEINYISAIPKNESGKTLYTVLEKCHE
jgi:acyl-coenzyme A synthetase/AMP-(fatty) acid ligase